MRMNFARPNAARPAIVLATYWMRMDQGKRTKSTLLFEDTQMTNQRTPHWVIQLRFLLLLSPFAIGLAILLAPWFFFVLAVCLGTGVVVFQAMRLFNHCFVRLFDPVNYELIKQNGGDSFYDSIAPPFNFDSDSVRKTGQEDH